MGLAEDVWDAERKMTAEQDIWLHEALGLYFYSTLLGVQKFPANVSHGYIQLYLMHVTGMFRVPQAHRLRLLDTLEVRDSQLREFGAISLAPSDPPGVGRWTKMRYAFGGIGSKIDFPRKVLQAMTTIIRWESTPSYFDEWGIPNSMFREWEMEWWEKIGNDENEDYLRPRAVLL